MTAPTTEQEVTAPPSFDGSTWPPEGAMWIPVAPPVPATTENDDTESTMRGEAPTAPHPRRKHVGAVAAAGGIVGGVAVWQAFGIMGLIAAGGAAAGLVAAPIAAYVLHKRRGRNRTPMGRSLRGRRLTRRTSSRSGSAGRSRGRGGPKLGGKGGPKLGGKGGGPKLGKGGGKLFSGKGGKLGSGKGGPKLGGKGGPKLGGKSGKLLGGKSGGKLLGGKAGKLGGGKSGKLFGGGRGKGLGGKLSSGRKSASSKLGSASKGGKRLLGRGGKAGLGLGKRGGKATRGAVGRWSKSSGAGALGLGRKAAAATRRRTANAAQRAAASRAGRRVAKAVQAAKRAHGRSTAKSPFARWRAAARAAHSKMPRYTRRSSNWAMGIGAGALALLAMLQLRLKAWRAKRSTRATGSTDTPPKSTPTNESSDRADSGWKWTNSTTHDSDEYTRRRPTDDRRFTPPPQPPPTIKVEVIRDEPPPPKAIGAARLAIGPARTTETAPIRKENMGFPLLDAAMEFSATASKYSPSSAHDLAPDFDRLPEVIAHLAAGFKHYATRIDEEEPVEAPVGEALFQLFNGIHQLVGTAEGVGPLHRQVHAHDIAKAEAPRGANEARWNV